MNIPWCVPLFDQADQDAVTLCMASTFINQGAANSQMENLLQRYFDVRYAVLTPNGTTAIALSLMALGIGHGDSVIVPDITFIGTASAVRLTGAEAILADVKTSDFTIDPVDVQRRIKPNTKAIVPVHLTGRSADLEALAAIASRHGLYIVEDAAEALGARNDKGFLGTQSVAGCFSLAPTKIITSGQGGFVFTPHEHIHQNIVRLKDHGRLARSSDEHPVTGFNFKLTDLQASLAMSQFKKLKTRIVRAREIDRLYMEALSDVPGITFPPRPPADSYLMWPDFTTNQRDELVAFMATKGISLRPFWPAIHTQPAYAEQRAFPGAEYASSHACWLPASPGLHNKEIDYIIRCIKEFH